MLKKIRNKKTPSDRWSFLLLRNGSNEQLLYLENTSFILLAIRSRSSLVKLEPDGKHKPFSNKSSATFPP